MNRDHFIVTQLHEKNGLGAHAKKRKITTDAADAVPATAMGNARADHCNLDGKDVCIWGSLELRL